MRQRQVLRRIGEGMKYAAIARELGISEHTVRVHANAAAAVVGYGYGHLPAQSALRQFVLDIGVGKRTA